MPYTFKGCGTRYYGQQDKSEDGSYVTTEWITFVYIPLVPIGSFRVFPFHSSQRYVLRVPLRWSQVRNVYLVVAPFFLLLLYFNRQDIDNWIHENVLKSRSTPSVTRTR